MGDTGLENTAEFGEKTANPLRDGAPSSARADFSANRTVDETDDAMRAQLLDLWRLLSADARQTLINAASAIFDESAKLGSSAQ
ncbi:MAG TPA: hypothetical protein VFG20_03095 [Planctomycetaceae bacterium]|jgi:hypothetical protein|nr:hypothetical protein [Planctomycetaceae bacterium]